MNNKLTLKQGAARAGGSSADGRPAIDPLDHPEYFDGIITKRVIAFLIDAAIIVILSSIIFVVVGLLGLLTFGVFFTSLNGVIFLIPFAYHGLTIGGRRSATFGMQFMEIEVRRWTGGPPDIIQAFANTILFYGSIAMTFWAILAIALFNSASRCAHDYLSGTVVINRLDGVKFAGDEKLNTITKLDTE